MTLQKAIAKALPKFTTISSQNLMMLEQDVNTLFFWVFMSPDTSNIEKVKKLEQMLAITDWTVDEEK